MPSSIAWNSVPFMDVIDAVPLPRRPDEDDDLDHGTVQFIGTATTLIRCAGFTVLTDPNFIHRGEQIHLGYGICARRRTDPALDIEELPPVDLLVVSHLHADHFDRVAERQLSKTLPIVTTPHAANALNRKGFQVTHPMAPWDSRVFVKRTGTLRITAMPAQHGPATLHRLLPQTMGSLLEFQPPSARPVKIYISGDTLLVDALREIPRRHPQIDLALPHLRGTRIMNILLTMDAEQGLKAMRLIGASRTIPIHYNDYPVFRSPLSDFKQLALQAGVEEQVAYLAQGESYQFAVAASVHRHT